MNQPISTATAATASAAVGRRWSVLALAIGLVMLSVDQLVKWWVEASLALGQTMDVIPGVLWWEHIRNPGAAFSLGSGSTWIFTVIQAAVVVGIVVTLRKVRDPWWAVALGLVLGGAAGNLGDRLFREPGFGVGHVVDFIAVPYFAIFNISDCCVVVGISLVLVLILRNRPLSGPETQQVTETTQGAEHE